MKTVSKNIRAPFSCDWSIRISIGAVLIVTFAIIMKPGILNANMQEHQLEVGDTGFNYESQDRRDPFQPLDLFDDKAVQPDSAVVEVTDREPSLKLLGIMSGPQGYHAMIKNSEGARYIITLGKVLHSEGLKVKLITESQLVLEYLVRGEGERQESPAREMVLSFHD